MNQQNITELNLLYDEITEIESLCMNCHKNGSTKMLLRKIPFFKDIVVISFQCEHCGFRNHEFTPLTPLEDKGLKLTLKVSKPEDLNRMIIANVNSVLYIPEIEFEVPKLTKGMVTTIQGFLAKVIEDLGSLQDERKKVDENLWQAVQKTIDKMEAFAAGNPEALPFYVIVNDPTGHSYIANPFAPLIDNNLKEEHYERTKEQMIDLGFVADTEVEENPDLKEKYTHMKDAGLKYLDELKKVPNYKFTEKDTSEMIKKMQGFSKSKDAHKLDHSKTLNEQDLDSKLTIINEKCYSCGEDGEMRVCTCEIPFFKEIVIMSFVCDKCGYRNNEVKTAGEISEFAKRITLSASTKEDLNRDLFKSDSAVVQIPELEFEMSPGTLGSFYTTVEGLLSKVIDNLKESNPFVGDSADSKQISKLNEFLKKMEQCRDGEYLPFTLILDDPLDNCFILNPCYPDKDPAVLVEEYERSHDQKEDLGLNSMKVD